VRFEPAILSILVQTYNYQSNENPVSVSDEYFVLGLDRTACSCDVALDRLGQPSAENSHDLGRTVRKAVELSWIRRWRSFWADDERNGTDRTTIQKCSIPYNPACAVELTVQIVRFVDHEPQPGLVACEFLDSEQRRHVIIDKCLIFSASLLDDGSAYPQPGCVPCEVIARWRDARGRDLIRVRTGRGGIESTEGLSEFVVLPEQLT
jgi:hypothetical protein